MQKKIYVIDGKDFESLDSFYEIISRNLIPNADWGKNLDAFNDILSGGFGTPKEGFVLVWENAYISREKLGYEETINWLSKKLKSAHDSHYTYTLKEVELAKNGKGETLFEMLVDIISGHSDIELRLNATEVKYLK